jgi:protein gp37
MGQKNYAHGFDLTLQPHMLENPLQWRKPRRIFVNSMSDLFHEDVPVAYIQQVFDVMRRGSWHQYQVLTKRSERLLELDPVLHWPPQTWMGVSVENEDFLFRVDHLRQTRAAIKFLSIEPLLGPLHGLDLRGIDWAIVGGESGPGARPLDAEWVREIRDRCLAAGVPFFFKQWGGVNKSRTGRVLDGRHWDEMPLDKAKSTSSILC